MKPFRLLLVAALLMPPAGCTSKDEANARAAEAEAEAKAGGIETVEIPPRPAPKVTVDDPGQEPRELLRLHPTKGDVDELEMSVGIRMSMRNGMQNMPAIPVPTTKTRLRAEVEDVGADGFSVRHAVEGVEVVSTPQTPEMVVTKVKESVEPLTQYRAVMRMDERGAVLGGTVEIPRDLPAMVHQTMQQMTESLGQLAAPLPEEPVGVGARWTAVHEIQQNGMKMRQTGHYSLLEREGDRLQLEVTIEQELLDPNVSPPGMLGGSARVGRFDSSGHGSLDLDLARITPASMSVTVDLSMEMDITVLGNSQHMEMDMGMDMDMVRSGAG